MALLAAILVAGATACGGDGEDAVAETVEIGSAPTEPGPPLEVASLPLDDTGATAFDRWPSACDLVTDEVVDAVLPQTEEIARTPTDRPVRIVGIGTESSEETIVAADCTVRIGLPIEGMGLDDDTGGVRLLVSVLASGEHDFVAGQAGDPIGEPIELARVPCFDDDARTITCVSERFAFSANLDMRGHGQYVGAPVDPYEVDGEARSFGPDDGGAEQSAFLAEVVLRPLVASVLARL